MGVSLDTLQPGEQLEFSLRLQAHLVSGSYQLSIAVRDVARGRDIVGMQQPLAFFVKARPGERGVANLYPTLIDYKRSAVTAPQTAAST